METLLELTRFVLQKEKKQNSETTKWLVALNDLYQKHKLYFKNVLNFEMFEKCRDICEKKDREDELVPQAEEDFEMDERVPVLLNSLGKVLYTILSHFSTTTPPETEMDDTTSAQKNSNKKKKRKLQGCKLT